MTYSDEEILRRLRLGEDSGWAFKQVEFSGDRPASPRRDDWADEITAFANASGGALLCGVSDDGEAQGMSRRQIANLDALLVEVVHSIKPPVRIRTDHRELAGGKPVLVVEVLQGDSLHEAPGGAYLRVGASKRLMTSDERMRLAQRRGPGALSLVRRAACAGHGIRDIGGGAMEAAVERRGRGRP